MLARKPAAERGEALRAQMPQVMRNCRIGVGEDDPDVSGLPSISGFRPI